MLEVMATHRLTLMLLFLEVMAMHRLSLMLMFLEVMATHRLSSLSLEAMATYQLPTLFLERKYHHHNSRLTSRISFNTSKICYLLQLVPWLTIPAK